MIVGRLIPAGTGYSYHAEQRRTREQELAAELRELDQASAAAAAAQETAAEEQAEGEAATPDE